MTKASKLETFIFKSFYAGNFEMKEVLTASEERMIKHSLLPCLIKKQLHKNFKLYFSRRFLFSDFSVVLSISIIEAGFCPRHYILICSFYERVKVIFS